MEDNRHPQFEEEQGIGLCCEPIAEAVCPAVRSAEGITEVHDWIDDFDWSKMPILGPKTEEEAIASIDEFEKQLAKGHVKWISAEDAWSQLYKKYPWLR